MFYENRLVKKLVKRFSDSGMGCGQMVPSVEICGGPENVNLESLKERLLMRIEGIRKRALDAGLSNAALWLDAKVDSVGRLRDVDTFRRIAEQLDMKDVEVCDVLNLIHRTTPHFSPRNENTIPKPKMAILSNIRVDKEWRAFRFNVALDKINTPFLLEKFLLNGLSGDNEADYKIVIRNTLEFLPRLIKVIDDDMKITDNPLSYVRSERANDKLKHVLQKFLEVLHKYLAGVSDVYAFPLNNEGFTLMVQYLENNPFVLSETTNPTLDSMRDLARLHFGRRAA